MLEQEVAALNTNIVALNTTFAQLLAAMTQRDATQAERAEARRVEPPAKVSETKPQPAAASPAQPAPTAEAAPAKASSSGTTLTYEEASRRFMAYGKDNRQEAIAMLKRHGGDQVKTLKDVPAEKWADVVAEAEAALK